MSRVYHGTHEAITPVGAEVAKRGTLLADQVVGRAVRPGQRICSRAWAMSLATSAGSSLGVK